jgi:hypothetical protein
MVKTAGTTFVMLAALLLAGCHKPAAQQKTTAPVAASTPAISGLTIKDDPPPVAHDLGTITLTNHCETCVSLGPGKDCLLTPNVIDSHNVQITVAVESKKSNGKIHDLTITQVLTKSGKPFEVAVGAFNFSLTPNIASD